jgi:hypothetical protein
MTAGRDNYIRPAVKIESGAKSALDPHEDLSIVPYVSEEAPQLALRAEHVTTVVAQRTFWDKIIIVHELRCWFEERGVLRGEARQGSRRGVWLPQTKNKVLRELNSVDHRIPTLGGAAVGAVGRIKKLFAATPIVEGSDAAKRERRAGAGLLRVERAATTYSPAEAATGAGAVAPRRSMIMRERKLISEAVAGSSAIFMGLVVLSPEPGLSSEPPSGIMACRVLWLPPDRPETRRRFGVFRN